MNIDIQENLIRAVILDITGVYVQIYDQGYYNKVAIDELKKQYSDTEHWRVVVLDE